MRKLRPRVFAVPTRHSLENAALAYLARFAASEASLRGVLMRRLSRAAFQNAVFAQDEAILSDLYAAIDRIIEKYKKLGVLDDAAFAETKVGSLRRQGKSQKAIVQKLCAKGVAGEHISLALEKNARLRSADDVEFEAAMVLAKKRKVGPFRKGASDEARRVKDFAIFARAGFSLAVAKRVLGKEILEDGE